MTMALSSREGALLQNLLGETSGDKVIRLNPQGFIDKGSDDLADLGVDLSSMLLPPHIADLAGGAYSKRVLRHVETALGGDGGAGWIEFPIAFGLPEIDDASADAPRWFALSVRRMVCDMGQPTGAIGLLRSVERVRTLEDELFASALTDPLTGLVNRNVFLARLRGELHEGSGGFLVVMAIDRMRALTMQYGQRTADEVSWGFARFLQAMALPGCEMAQLDTERFAAILPGVPLESARSWTQDCLDTFSSLALPSSGKVPRFTASAGLTTLENSVDWTMRQAELALIMARAGGGNQLALGGKPTMPSVHAITAPRDRASDRLGDSPLRR